MRARIRGYTQPKIGAEGRDMGRAGRHRVRRHTGSVRAAARPAHHAPRHSAAIRNYSAEAGAGSRIITNISESPGWRAALLGTVAAGSLWLYSARSARAQPDDCTLSGTAPNEIATCQGDQSDGISSAGGTPDFNPANVETLNVNTGSTDIAPASGVDGIYFHRTGAGNDVIINSNTTPFEIIVNGANADGIDAMSDAAITITHTGNIDASAGRYGIFAQSGSIVLTTGESLSITSEGEVAGGLRGIDARNYGDGALEIVASGAVTGNSTTGIYARQANGAATGPLGIRSRHRRVPRH